MHSVPVMEHEGIIATDSHSILMYLAERNNSPLFPKALAQRTDVINKLMFNGAHFFTKDSALFVRKILITLSTTRNQLQNPIKYLNVAIVILAINYPW